MKKRILLAVFLVIALSTAILFTGCSDEKQSNEPKQSPGQSRSEDDSHEDESTYGILKSFEAKTLDGSTFTQEDIAKKDVTVINFWALTCGPCIAEMPDLADFTGTLPDNLQVITVCLDGAYDTDGVKDILNEAGFNGVTLIKGNGDFVELCNEIMYTPTTVFADKDGNITGDVIIGGQEDLAGAYTEAINKVLKSMGKAELANEKE